MKYLFLKSFFFLAICFLSAPLLAQGETLEVLEVDSFFQTFAGLVATIPFLTEFFKKLLGKTESSPNLAVQIFSWVVGLFLAIMGKLLGLGYLAELSWLWVIVYGLGAALAANGVADTKIIVKIFKLFKKSA